jgi:hypothetical protein
MKKRIGLLKPVVWMASRYVHRLAPLALYFMESAPSPRSLFRTEDANGLPAFMLFLGDEEKHIVQCGVWYRIWIHNHVSEGEFPMRRVLLCGLSVFAVCALLSTAVLAASHNPADYPLRVHIFTHNSVSHYYWRSLDQVDGEGRANIYENGDSAGLRLQVQLRLPDNELGGV